MLPIDPATFRALFGLFPWLLLYSLLVTLGFGAVAIAFSALMKSRVKIMLVIMLLIMLVFFGGMILRVVSSGAYETYYLFLNINYNLITA